MSSWEPKVGDRCWLHTERITFGPLTVSVVVLLGDGSGEYLIGIEGVSGSQGPVWPSSAFVRVSPDTP